MTGGTVTIVTQTRVQAGQDEAFARWQEVIGRAIAGFAGFIDQSLIRPSPPAQADWVILQRFATAADAIAWLNSPERLALVENVQPLLVGRDDVHIMTDPEMGNLPAPVSAVISTRIKPGCEAAYRAWEQRIATAQTRSPGFQGYRFEAPIPGVQEDWVAVLRFDTEPNLQRWLELPERRALLQEAAAFTEEFHSRIVHSGFDQWFPTPGAGTAGPPVWKQNLVVLLMLYPVVYLFGHFVQAPLLADRAHLPFPVALLIGNMVSVVLLNVLVPWTGARFGWWLRPAGTTSFAVDARGAVLITALLVGLAAAFTLWS